MQPFTFESFEIDGVFTYRYIGDGSVVGRHWPGLFQVWPEGPTPMSEFNVTSNNCEEVAVYLGFVWQLCHGRAVYAIPEGQGAYVAHALGDDCDLVKWEFAVEVEEGPELGRPIGFVRAHIGTHWTIDFADDEDRASPADPSQPLTAEAQSQLAELEELSARVFADSPRGPRRSKRPADPAPRMRAVPLHPPGWQPEWDSHAVLYPVNTFTGLRDVQAVTLADAASSVTIFAIESARKAALGTALAGESPPTVDDLLASGELLVSLNVGIDVGYRDVLVVQSTTEIAERIDSLAASFEQRIRDYEASVDEIADVPSFLVAINRLAGLAPASDSR